MSQIVTAEKRTSSTAIHRTTLLGAVFALAFVVALPLLVRGPLPQAHDGLEHLNFSRNFTAQFWEGEPYPRWLMTMNHGLGSPVFFVFPPLPFYIRALLEPFGQFLHFSAFNVAAFLSLFASGVFAYLWMRNSFDRVEAAVGAALYIVMPYHLAINFYRRFDLPECWALAWIPLTFYFTENLVVGKKHAFAGLSLSYASLIFSHAITAGMIAVVLLGMALEGSGLERRFRAAVAVTSGLLLGAGVAAVYLFPAFVHERYIRPSTLLKHYGSTNDLIRIGRQVIPGSASYTFASTTAWIALDMIVVVALCAWVVMRHSEREPKKVVGFWLVVCAVAVFMMSELSAPLWFLIPQLRSAVQFSFRFNIILCGASLPVIVLFFGVARSRRFRFRGWLLVFVGLQIALWLAAWGWESTRYFTEQPLPAVDRWHIVNDWDGWFFAWAPPDLDQQAALRATGEAKARFVDARGSVRVLSWKPRRIALEAESATGGTIVVAQLYYPAWRAERHDGSRLTILTPQTDGLIRVNVAAGPQKLILSIPRGLSERAGAWTSAFCGLVCALLLLRGRDAHATNAPA